MGRIQVFLRFLIVLVVSPLTIVSCIAPSPAFVSPDYQLSKNHEEGLVMFSVRCFDKTGEQKTGVLEFNPSVLVWSVPSIDFKCDGLRKIEMLRMNQGDYSFYSFGYTGKEDASLNFPEIDFSVVPDKVNYIGSLNISMGEKIAAAKVENNSDIDIPMAKRKFSNIPRGDYIIRLMQIPN